jgi:predicted PhzF superfamily epimerase YddE/YHI9
MPQPVVQVDAFTDRPFAGNPAAVCPLEAPLPEALMQDIAAENNLSETAFFVPAGGGFHIRWFTPVKEVPLCGHATLASAHVLWTEDRAEPGQTIRFDTASGPLAARPSPGGTIWLDFPATPAERVDPPPELMAGLGVGDAVRWVGLGRFDYLVELEGEAAVRGLAPDFGRLGRLEHRGVIVTASAGRPPAGTRSFDFVSRYFAPAVGIDEDPVTGSAHCTLGPYWAERLGRAELTGFQASARGGVVQVRTAGDRVLLGGQAVTVLRGELV